MFFVTHAPTMAALGAHQVAMWNMMNEDNSFPESPMECEDQSEAFQRVGPGTADAPYDFFAVDYWPCKYTEGADPVALRDAQAKFAMEHYAHGAEEVLDLFIQLQVVLEVMAQISGLVLRLRVLLHVDQILIYLDLNLMAQKLNKKDGIT